MTFSFKFLSRPSDVIKKLEKAVNSLIEESVMANAAGDFQTVCALIKTWQLN